MLRTSQLIAALLLIGATWMLSPAAALANEPQALKADPGAQRSAEIEMSAAGNDVGMEQLRTPVVVSGMRAEASLGRLGVFASGKGVTYRRQATMNDVEGGAQLRLLRNLVLTGSYRLFDYDFDLGGKLDARMSGPFLGMTLRF